MMDRDQLGWVCQQHGRVSFGNDSPAERAAADHIRTEHPQLWVALCDAERVPSGAN